MGPINPERLRELQARSQVGVAGERSRKTRETAGPASGAEQFETTAAAQAHSTPAQRPGPPSARALAPPSLVPSQRSQACAVAAAGEDGGGRRGGAGRPGALLRVRVA